MAEKRKRQRRRDDEADKPTKEEYNVAKFLRFNLPPKEGKLVGMSVQYFIASKAVDLLLTSKWGGDKGRQGVLFPNRSSCVDYCNRLLEKGIFHRAAKVEKKKDKKKKKKDSDKEEEEEEEKEKKKDKKLKKDKKETDKEKKTDKKESEKENEKKSEKDTEVEKDVDKKKKKDKNNAEEEKKDEDKKKKKKMKLEMHDYQLFEDGDNVYVWIYDPVPMKTFIIGLLLVLGAGAVCLFPLWPPEVRLGVYYLSLAAACFVGFILVLCVVRVILFCIIWVLTMGKHHFWLLPNLTEDVGFFDSFKPLYHHEAVEKVPSDSDSSQSKDRDNKKSTNKSKTKEQKEGEESGEEEGESENESNSEEGAENDNGYEMIDANEISESENQLETKKDK